MPRLISSGVIAIAVLLCVAPRAVAAGSVIVKFRSGVSSSRRHAVEAAAGAGRGQGHVRVSGATVVETARPSTTSARLNASSAVLYAEPNAQLRVAAAAFNDPLFSQQTDLGLIHASEGWPAAGSRIGVPVGIVDTGIDSHHEDLLGKVKACATATGGTVQEGACADDNGHGTHVAGTIGALAGNGAGIVGLAFTSPLIICKALDANGSGSLADVANCIDWAHRKGAKVISLSLGGGASTTLEDAVGAAYDAGKRGGSLIVAAAGNDGNTSLEYPAAYPGVVSVAATDDRGAHAPFSNVNEDVEIAAPGINVLSARLGGGYVRMSGTSMATPHAAAAAALVWDTARSSGAATIRARLDALTADAGVPGRDASFGFGVLDLARLGR